MNEIDKHCAFGGDAMVFIFLIGVEGVGHHMIRALLQKFLESRNVIDLGDCDWHRILVDHWDPDFQPNWSGREEIRRKLITIFDRYRRKGVTHLFESASFPFGQPRNPLRRPDIKEFFDLFRHCLDIKFLVLYRDPVSAAYSAIRRKFTENWKLQAKIVEDNLIYIEKQLTISEGLEYRVLSFEDFVEAPGKFAEPIAGFLKLDKEMILDGLTRIKKPLKKTKIPVKYRKPLENYFDGHRRSQWSCLLSKKSMLTGI